MFSAPATSRLAGSMPHSVPRLGLAGIAPVAIGFALSIALCWGNVVDIWTTGNFYDPDDAMRMSQVRDFLDGQSWYDMTAWRLDPANGSFMHWSRVVDAPLAILMKLFGSHAPGDAGERLTRIVFPLLLQLALLASLAWIGRLMFGTLGAALSMSLAVLSGYMFTQFVPGRVDHHAPQIVLLMLMIGAMLVALDPARARYAAMSAVCASLSLAISVENLPFILVLFATPPLVWVTRGERSRNLPAWFAGALGVSAPTCFVLFNGPSRWLVPACDAFSLNYLAIAFGAVAVCAAAVLAGARFRTAMSRAALIGCVGLAVGLPVAFVALPCLIDPFAGLDPLIRSIWLDHVGEATPALKHLSLYPRAIQTIAIPAVIGLAGLCLAVWRERGLSRARFALLLCFAPPGLMATAFMIRASTSLSPVLILGSTWIAATLLTRIRRAGLGEGAALSVAVAATVPMSSVGWAMAPTIASYRAGATSPDMSACLAARNYEPLARAPIGVVVAPIDMGAHILAHTRHGVLSAPYHRDNAGNRAAIDVFMANAEFAADRARATGADYLVVCPEAKELVTIAARSPASLAATLITGNAPTWMIPLNDARDPIRIYRITKP